MPMANTIVPVKPSGHFCLTGLTDSYPETKTENSFQLQMPGYGTMELLSPGSQSYGQDLVEKGMSLEQWSERLLDDPADQGGGMFASQGGEDGQRMNDVAQGARADDQYSRTGHGDLRVEA